MRINGTHVYLGKHPDRDLTEEEKAKQTNIRPSAGPREIIPGLLSMGEKSKRKILEGNALPKNAQGEEKNSPANIAELRRITYDSGRYYQGTTQDEARQWQDGDMDPAKKLTTSAAKLDQHPGLQNNRVAERFVKGEIKTAMAHLYFTQDKSPKLTTRGEAPGAASYAAMKATKDNPPKLVRTFFSKTALETLGFDRDPSSGNGIMTSGVVPNGYLLKEKNSPVEVSEASEGFKETFNNNREARRALKIDTVITSEQAAQWLSEERTPSAKDEFPRLRGAFEKMDFRNTQNTQPKASGDRTKTRGPEHADLLTDNELTSLAQSLQHASGGPTSLDLRGRKMSESAANELLLAMAHPNCKVKTLDLRNSNTVFEGIMAVRAFELLSHLGPRGGSLDLRGNTIPDEVRENLRQAAQLFGATIKM